MSINTANYAIINGGCKHYESGFMEYAVSGVTQKPVHWLFVKMTKCEHCFGSRIYETSERTLRSYCNTIPRGGAGRRLQGICGIEDIFVTDDYSTLLTLAHTFTQLACGICDMKSSTSVCVCGGEGGSGWVSVCLKERKRDGKSMALRSFLKVAPLHYRVNLPSFFIVLSTETCDNVLTPSPI